jgi:hypothetical protein
MRQRWATTAMASAIAGALALISIAPASGITFGQPDGGEHPNVGALIGTVDGESFQWCTGTLVGPRAFLTASHCLDGFEDVDFTVSFDEVIDADADGLIDPTVVQLSGTPHTHPDYASGGNNNTFDVAVFLLDAAPGLEFAPLPAAGSLDARSVRSSVFTAVGYGTVRNTKRTGPASFELGTKRLKVDQTVNSVVKSWITFSMNPSTGNGGTCYGDSGGPHFLGDVVVSLTVTGDFNCRSTDKTYRLDTASARDFLDNPLFGIDLP